MAAFRLAAAAGADGIELDVRTCRSGELVVAHDVTLARCTSGRDGRAIADLDWAELVEVDLGAGERVPLLRSVLDWARQRGLQVNVEMKRDVPDRTVVVRETSRALAQTPDAGSFVIVSSFDGWMLRRLGALLPGIVRGLLSCEGDRFMRSIWAARLVGAQAVHPERTAVTAHRCARWKAAGMLVNTWTVNDVSEARRLALLGVDAIVTDEPGAVVEALG